jgi:hypothetical protein
MVASRAMLLSRACHRRAAWVALFALWLQLALSFGHRHAEEFAGLGEPSASFAAQADRSASPGSPANPNPDGLAHEACAICAAVSLAGCLILPDLALAVAPVPAGRQSLRIRQALVLVDASYRLFQTRAPPVI